MARGAREFADHGDSSVGAQRQQRLLARRLAAHRLVAQQHHAVCGDPSGGVVVLGVECGWVTGRMGGRAFGCVRDHRSHAAGSAIDHRLVEATTLDGCHHLGIARATVSRHLQVETSCERGDPVAYRTPVGDDQAVVPPLVAQHLGEQPRVLGGEHAVDGVVGAHHRPRVGVAHDPLERPQVELAKWPFVDVGADPQPIVFLVVGGEVLERGPHALRLHTAHPCGAQQPGEEGVLGEVLEVAPAQQRALEVDAWPENDGHVLGARLRADHRPDLLDQRWIEGGAERDGRWEAGGRVAVTQAEVVSVASLLAQAVWPVGQHHRGDAGDGLGVPEVLAGQQGGLLGQRQGDDGVDIAHGRHCASAAGRCLEVSSRGRKAKAG